MSTQPGEKNEAQQSETEEKKVVEVDAEVYDALLHRLDELTHKAESKDADADDDDQDAKPAAASKPVDLNRLDNEQLAKYIASELQNDVILPLLVRVSQLELQEEERRLRSEVVKPGDDASSEKFEEIKSRALEILNRRPNLSLKEAYRIAEADHKPSARKLDITKLKDLPKRAAVHGEKPSSAPHGDVTRKMPKDIRGATDRALEDLGVKFPDGG